MLKCNIQDMTDLELSEMLGAITAEQEKRKNYRKECLWQDVVDAVKIYCQEFGAIEVCSYGGQATIGTCSDLKEIGHIGV